MVIQLDEVVPPPPSTHKALLSPVQSSSQSYDYYSSSEEYEVEDEEEEEATESYCSSDLLGPGSGTGDPERASAVASAPVEQTVRMSRVLAWRNSFDSVFAEDNTGMFHLFPSLYPFLATRYIPTSGDFGFVGLVPTYPGCPLPSHVSSLSFPFFSHLRSSSSVDVTEAEVLARNKGW